MRRALVFLVAVAAGSACTTHIAPYRPKRRSFDPGGYESAPKAASGSLYAMGGRGLFEDNTASRMGDMLVIRIDERDSASRDASSKLQKKSDTNYAVPSAFGLMAALQAKYPDLDPAKLFSQTADNNFDGSGKLARKGSLSATLPVRIRKVLGNGDLFVEGTKVVLVGQEEHHIYVSGIVRRADIAADNSVPSSRVAEAEIEYTGRGDVSDQQRQGWLNRLMGKLWPF